MAITRVSLFVLGMGHFNLMFFKKFSMVLKRAQFGQRLGHLMIPNSQSGSSNCEYFNAFSFIGALIPSLGFLFKLIPIANIKIPSS
jgi:hypothetical protein